LGEGQQYAKTSNMQLFHLYPTFPHSTMAPSSDQDEVAIADTLNYHSLHPGTKIATIARRFKVSYWKLRNRRAGRPPPYLAVAIIKSSQSLKIKL
jgi:hypothetical protein